MKVMKKDVQHSILLISTLFVSYIISESFFGRFQLQIIAVVFIAYYLFRRTIFSKLLSRYQNMLDSIIYVFVITLAIQSSGKLGSPFFFLYYFLLFALSLLLEPNIVIIFSLGIIGMYIATTKVTLSLYPDLVPLISLPFMTPFALILGGEYNKIVSQKKKIERLEVIKKVLERKSARNDAKSQAFLYLIIKTHIAHALKQVYKLSPGPITNSIINTLTRTSALIEKFEKDHSK